MAWFFELFAHFKLNHDKPVGLHGQTALVLFLLTLAVVAMGVIALPVMLKNKYDPKLATGDWDDVSFLGYPHRHIFHFRVWIEVFHNDRDIEFIQFKRWMERLYDGVLELDYKSCEMIADDLALLIQAKYPGRWLKISVAEDNENGCEMEYPNNSDA